ncbi:large subunit ribosomal protein L25 [Hydrogenispora ethanolica]|jgi:large subunit ribosomal protein L25|uniref:Large ribosomal subunit protein bL25 n=1 Tax=Hydrogenispora ethanolica TaxID=1082276 RepID=A0A4R1SA25_HYDET|nr:50S ribosomal protein L25 [Hydrogenispora ethanolica]TCL76346.1 large subunit ribosomal protein L25 [Hydrogenispora ethanolica]
MELSLSAVTREGVGTLKVRKLRNEGQIPAVLYGEGKPNQNIAVNGRELEILLREGSGKLINLQLKLAKGVKREHVLIKELQKHPVKGGVTHLDLLRVAMDQPVTVKVPLRLVHEEKRPRDGAVLETMIHELEVSCLPTAIPEHIEVDISGLNIGETIHVKDLQLAPGVKVLNSPEEALVLASAPTVAETPPPAEAAEAEVAEGKQAE